MITKLIGYAAACHFLFCGTAYAQEWNLTGRIIGTVEIPVLHEALNSGRDVESSAAVKLYEKPSYESNEAVIVKNWRQIVFVEHGYEQVSAVVFQRVLEGGPWYKVRYAIGDCKGTGWLSPRDAGKHRTFFEIIHKSLSYMTDAWDHRLYKSPNPNAPFEILSTPMDRSDASVASVANIDGEEWLLVVIQDGTVCGDGPRTVLGAGWVPAYSKSGKITAWYHSRGC